MSIALMTAAWALEIGATDKIVLLALADHANDDGYCWPGNSSLQRKCGLSERAVRMALRSLEDAGHLTCHFAVGKSTSYHIHPGTTCPRQEMPPAPRAATPAPRAPKSSINTNKLTEGAGAKAKRKAFRCPADWQPSPLTPELAVEVGGYPPGWIERQLAGMRDWSASSPNGAKLDWDATWRGWLRRAIEKEPNNGNTIRQHGAGHSGQRAQPSGRLGAALELLAEVRAANAH